MPLDPKVVELSPQRKAEAWLDDLIDKAARLPAGETLPMSVELTPAMAEVLTHPARNPDNRLVSDYIVARYARDISTGHWAQNGQSMVLSREGLLNDGQHRCYAVVEAKRSIPVVLVFGADRHSRKTLDQGKVRTTSDVLVMEGIAAAGDARYLGAVANFLLMYRRQGNLFQGPMGTRPTRAEITDLVQSLPDLARHIRAVPTTGILALGGRPFLAFCHYVIAERSSFSAAREFFQSFFSGAGLPAGSPILYVRNRLITESGRLKPNEKAELVFRGWNAWRRGDTQVRSLQILNSQLPYIER